METEHATARRLMVLASICLLSVASLAPFHAAGAPAEPSQRPQQSATIKPVAAAGGAVTALAWDGTLAYAGVGTRIAAYTVSPPQILAWSDPMADIAESMSAAGGTVAVRMAAGAGREIRILTREADNLIVAGRIPGDLLAQPFHGMALSPSAEKLFVVAAGVLTVRFVPTGEPIEGLRLDGVRGRPAAGQGFVLVGNADGGLAVVAEGTGHLERVGFVSGPDLDEVILVAPDRALAVARGEAPGAQVIAYDLADRAAPTELGRAPLAAGAAFGAFGTRAVAAWSGSGRVQAFAAAGPVPLPRGVVTAHVPLAAVMADDLGLVGAAEGLFNLEASDPQVPSLVPGPFVGAGMAQAIAWLGDTAFVAQGHGLTTHFVGASDLDPLGSARRPGTAGGLTADLTNGSHGIAVGRAGAVYIASGGTGLLAYDAAAPASPSLVTHIPMDQLGGPALSVAAAGDSAYVGGPDKVWWVDTAAPLAPVLRGSTPVEGTATSLAVGANRLLVVADGRLFVADLVGGAPLSLEPHAAIEQAEAVAADGNLAVVVSGAKLFALDLTARPLPAVVGQVALPAPGMALSLTGTRAWVSTPDMLVAADMAEPAGVVAALRVRDGSARALAGRADSVLTAGGFRGIQRLDLVDGNTPTPTPLGALLLPTLLKGSRSGLTSP